MKTRTVPTLETIFTDPRYLGVTTATPVQRAKCRLVEGRPLGDLARDPDVIEMLGGPAAVRSLPDRPPAEVLDISASRVGKTLFGVALCIWSSQVVDVSEVSPGDIVRFHIAALKLEGCKPFMNHLLTQLDTKPALRSICVGEPTMSNVYFRHPSGRVVENTPVPIDRAGGSALSVYSSGAFIDEYPRMHGQEDAVRNIDHFRDAISGRMLRRSVFLATGSPWAPYGPCYNAVTEFWGAPSKDLLVLRTTGRAANPFWWTKERCADLERRNHTAYMTDVLAQFADRESALIPSTDLQAVTRASPVVLLPEAKRVYVAAIDPGTRRNAFTLVIATFDQRGADRVTRVALARQWVPGASRLDPEAVFREIASVCKPYGVRVLHTDQHSIDSNAALARRYGLTLYETVVTAANKTPLYLELAAAIASRRFECCPDAVVRSDLLGIRRRVTQAGVSVELATTSDGRHSDYAPAVALAHRAVSISSANSNWTERLRKRESAMHWDNHPHERGGRGFY